MKALTSLALLLTSLYVVIDGHSPSKGQQESPVQVELVKRRGGLGPPVRMVQRGRKRTIWSYNPGHRSLAFLVAGEVDTVTPPPLDPGIGEDRCLGCCENKVMIPGGVTAAPKISNRVNRILRPPEGPGDLGAEPNAINDRCLGCCEESVTPATRGRSTQPGTPATRGRSTQPGTPATRGRSTPPGTPTTRGHSTHRQLQRGPTAGPQRGATTGRQGPRQTPHGGTHKPLPPPCTPPKCNPDWRYESSSSSEEMPVIRRHRSRSRQQTAQLRSGSRCRHLGCRSALGLGAAPDDSSSSEED